MRMLSQLATQGLERPSSSPIHWQFGGCSRRFPQQRTWKNSRRRCSPAQQQHRTPPDRCSQFRPTRSRTASLLKFLRKVPRIRVLGWIRLETVRLSHPCRLETEELVLDGVADEVRSPAFGGGCDAVNRLEDRFFEVDNSSWHVGNQ